MQQFECAGRHIERIRLRAERLAGRIHQRRAQAFAAAQRDIAHGRVQPAWFEVGRRQAAVEGGFEAHAYVRKKFRKALQFMESRLAQSPLRQ